MQNHPLERAQAWRQELCHPGQHRANRGTGQLRESQLVLQGEERSKAS